MTFYQKKLIHTFGVEEICLEEMFHNLIQRDHFPIVESTTQNGIITFKILTKGKSKEEANEKTEEISRLIYSYIGEFIFGEDNDTLPQVISHSLRAQCRKVGIFEWGTHGRLSAVLEPDVLAFSHIFGNSDILEFSLTFGVPTTVPFSQVVERNLSKPLLELCTTESKNQNVDYFLVVGPYLSSSHNHNTRTQLIPTTEIIFIDFRDPDNPVLYRETLKINGHLVNIDSLFCNHALDILRRRQ